MTKLINSDPLHLLINPYILYYYHDSFASNLAMQIANACSNDNGFLKSMLKQSSVVLPICKTYSLSASIWSISVVTTSAGVDSTNWKFLTDATFALPLKSTRHDDNGSYLLVRSFKIKYFCFKYVFWVPSSLILLNAFLNEDGNF